MKNGAYHISRVPSVNWAENLDEGSWLFRYLRT